MCWEQIITDHRVIIRFQHLCAIKLMAYNGLIKYLIQKVLNPYLKMYAFALDDNKSDQYGIYLKETAQAQFCYIMINKQHHPFLNVGITTCCRVYVKCLKNCK